MRIKPIRVIVFIATLIITLAMLWYTDGKGHYKKGENGNLSVEVGDTFIIKLDENGSTGSGNCWLTNIKVVKLKSAEFTSNSKADGAGGVTTYTFEAIAKGIDTLKVANCPLAHDNKKCSDYNEKNTKPDNVFVVRVME
ncbi:protease inhibitor I42 family protein [Flavobacterium sp. DGU11]|uniref:Protease inhibitor I42 family protein n=1 Tax=Flavobacterium arundinis TaxID=3139143 RepID=A0ABU9HZ24_9FLAO